MRYTTKQMKKIFASLWALVPALFVMAQTDTLPSQHLQEVTVTETLHQRALSSTAPVQLLDHHDMRVMGVTDVADALHRLPGITLRDYGGAGGMKTVSVRGFGAKHTGVNYDGVMLSECQSGEIDLSRYSLDNVEHITLAVGDNDDIFVTARQASTPATLSITTLRLPSADHDVHLTSQLRLGSFGYTSPFLRYEQSITDKVALSLVGEYTYAENDYPYTIRNVRQIESDRRRNSMMNTGHVELNASYIINKVSRISGKVYYYDNDRQLPGQVRYYSNLSKEQLRDRNFLAQALYQTRWNDKFSLRWHAKYNWAMSDYSDPLFPQRMMDACYWQRETYTAASLLYTPDSHWAFDYSADYAYNNLNASKSTIMAEHPYRHTILQSGTAKYRSSRFTAIARLLYSLYLNEAKGEGKTARNMRRLSPSLSLAFRIIPERDFYVRASYKNIFRAPTFNESYYYHYGSSDLLPESTNQLNIGITAGTDISSHTNVRFTLDGYVNHVHDMILAVPQNMFVWTCINVGKVSTRGADATLRSTHHIGRNHKLTLAATYSYLQAEERSNSESPFYGNQIAYMPRNTWSGSVSYENPWLNLAFHGAGISSRYTNNEHLDGTLVDGYSDFGATAWHVFHVKRHSVELRADVKNLFDEQYEVVRWYPMPGRSWQFTLSYKL